MKNIFKKIIAVATFIIATQTTFAQNNVGIGTNSPNASAVLDMTATDKGMLIPRMNASQRVAIASPAEGLMVYQTDAPKGFYYYDGSAWTALGGSSNTTLPNVEVSDKVTTSQTFSKSGNTTIAPFSSTIIFSGTNSTNATLTGGNTWDGSKFTAKTAGWYQIHIQMYAVNNLNTIPSIVGIRYLLDKNDTLGTATRIGAYAYSQYDTDQNGSNNNTPKSAAGNLDCIIYLAANDYIDFKGWSMSAIGAAAYSSTDGSSNITIVRIK